MAKENFISNLIYENNSLNVIFLIDNLNPSLFEMKNCTFLKLSETIVLHVDSIKIRFRFRYLNNFAKNLK